MNEASAALEAVLDQGRPGVPWCAITVVIGAAYFSAHIIAWAVNGFPR